MSTSNHQQSGPRLAYLVSQYPAFSHTFILREIACLRRHGFTIDVASINPPDRPLGQLTEDERCEAESTLYVKRQSLGRVFGTLLWSLLRHPSGFARSLVYCWRLARFDIGRLVFNHFYWIEALLIGRWMESHRLRHLHVHFATPAATVALIVRQAFPIEYSITVHGPDEFYDVTAHHLREKMIHAKFVLCISHFARSQLMKLSPSACWDKFHVCRLGVDPALFHPAGSRVERDGFTVLSVGRLAEAKGHPILLRAIRRIVESGRAALRLILVGGGPLQRELADWVARNRLSEIVTLTGPIDQDHIRELYAQADCFALASFAEGIPVVLMEAMAMELPCVTTHITGIPELIRDGRDGLLVAPGDEKSLAEALQRLMEDPELRERLGRAGRARVEADYQLEQNMAFLARTMTALLSTLPRHAESEVSR